MREKEFKEGLGDLAHMAEKDHEVQMARAELYKLAKYAIKLHEMLKGVSEAEGLEGWVQAKITKSADMIGSVYHHLDYEESPMGEVTEEVDAPKMDVTDADKKANSPAYQKMKKGNPRYVDKTTKKVKEGKDKTCSDKCCGSEVKAEDCKCPPTCDHCNCNAVDEGITGAVAGGILGSAGGPLGTAAGAYLGHKIQKGAKKKKKQDEDKDEVAESFARMRLLAGLPINEDDVTKVAVGHVDAEADMLRKELFKIGKYSVELYKMLGELPDGDFPHWWQAKIVKAGEYIGSAKHYLEGEMYAPEEESPIDRPPEEQEDINPSGI